MRSKDLIRLGFDAEEVLEAAMPAVKAATRAGLKKGRLRRALSDLMADPASFEDDPHFAEVAALLTAQQAMNPTLAPRKEAVPYERWGRKFKRQVVQQMESACTLPVAVRGGLMPNASFGRGLPSGGVLATQGAVIPGAVGVDIACRMKMTVVDLPVTALADQASRLRKAIEEETCFGLDGTFENRREHAVLDRDWTVSPITRLFKDKAWAQLGTSGGGSHFVEWGELRVESAEAGKALGLEPQTYLALLSHSGSRGAGAKIASYYGGLAMGLHPKLSGNLKHLAWLDLDSRAGQEYWQSMELMDHYASANHECIHQQIMKHLGLEALFSMENMHNFARQEEHDGEELIVHRKGAMSASLGELGVNPGTMADPSWIVRGLGHAGSLRSAAHGVGRKMSRKKARFSIGQSQIDELLKERDVTLLSAVSEEAPMVYREIEEVMVDQADLVESLASFFPRLVKMAPREPII